MRRGQLARVASTEGRRARAQGTTSHPLRKLKLSGAPPAGFLQGGRWGSVIRGSKFRVPGVCCLSTVQDLDHDCGDHLHDPAPAGHTQWICWNTAAWPVHHLFAAATDAKVIRHAVAQVMTGHWACCGSGHDMAALVVLVLSLVCLCR
jgi:hypothetical protein